MSFLNGRLHCQGHLETETFAILDSPHVDELVFRALVPGTPGVVVPPGGSPVAAMARAAAQMQALYIIVYPHIFVSHRFHIVFILSICFALISRPGRLLPQFWHDPW